MRAYGLTGGIGCGKTTVSRIFSVLSVPVFYADDHAKDCYFDPEVITAIQQKFGDEVFADGLINRKSLAEKVFGNTADLQYLNALIHPRVLEMFEKWKISQAPASYVILESAILYEAKLDQTFDGMMTVFAPEELSLQRVMLRDTAERETVLQRIKNQMDPAEKLLRARFKIINDDSTLLIPQVLGIHQEIINEEED